MAYSLWRAYQTLLRIGANLHAAEARKAARLRLCLARAKQDAIELSPASLNTYFRLHLHRGISYLMNRATKDIAGLLELVVPVSRNSQSAKSR